MPKFKIFKYLTSS